MKSGFKVLLGFAAGAATGYLISKNSDKLAAYFDELCYKIDDLRDQFADYRCRHECDCMDECCECGDECECGCTGEEESEEDDSVVEDVIEPSEEENDQ